MSYLFTALVMLAIFILVRHIQRRIQQELESEL